MEENKLHIDDLRSNIQDADNESIDFDLSAEDLAAIKGGVGNVSFKPHHYPMRTSPFPIQIYPAPPIHPVRIFPTRIFLIEIYAPPRNPEDLSM